MKYTKAVRALTSIGGRHVRNEETIGKWNLSRRELIGLTETEIPELVPEIENLEMFDISVWEIA